MAASVFVEAVTAAVQDAVSALPPMSLSWGRGLAVVPGPSPSSGLEDGKGPPHPGALPRLALSHPRRTQPRLCPLLGDFFFFFLFLLEMSLLGVNVNWFILKL